jgi:hypothetical protein
MSRLNLRGRPADNAGVDQVSRPMQIALVAVVLLAGIWFTVLRPKADTGSPAPVAAQPAPVAPGVKGLTSAVDKAKGAAATSDAANARIQAATGARSAAAATPSATKAAPATSAAKAKAVAPGKKAAAPVKKAAAKTADDPSHVLLNFLTKGKTVVLLFHGDGADDQAARTAVHQVALDDKRVVAAYSDISRVGLYQAITSGVTVQTAPTVLVIGTDRKAVSLTGYVDAGVIEQAVGDARRSAAKSAK